MKIIALGDVHGNLPALEVALREARAEGYDLICHTGDLVGFAPFPEETVASVRAAKIAGVRGNVDEAIAEGAESFGRYATESAGQTFEDRAYAWTLEHTERTTRSFLGNLPFEMRLEIGARRAVLVHATPIDLYTPLWEETGEERFREMGDAAEADIIIFGHTHLPYHRVVDGRHFINAGSVGYPQDGDPRTGYAVIKTNGNVEVQWRRFPYDTARNLKTAADRQFPVQGGRTLKD
jgi:putative phosphoesterase